MNENIIHIAAIKLRVVGSGNLAPTLLSLDSVNVTILNPIPMQAITPIEPLRLTNFVSQKAMLRIETNNIDETFTINRIVIYVKPIFSSLPNIS